MDPSVGPFEAFYASPLQHPLLLWLAAGVGLAIGLAGRSPSSGIGRYCVALALLSVVDAWLTSTSVLGIGALTGWTATAVPLFFVLAGDYRYWLLVCAAEPRGGLDLRGSRLLAAGGLTLVVPLTSQLARHAFPESLDSPRALFLLYELLFVFWLAGLLRWYPRLRGVPWLGSVSRFVMLYYALWATADLLIGTTGSDLGYGLRVVPNALYYGGLIAVIGRWAPTAAGSETAPR